MSKIKYSIIIPSFTRDEDHLRVLHECVNSVRATVSENAELILVDDGSTWFDPSYDNPSWKETLDFDTLIQHQENRGIAPSWNDGIAIARGYYIAIINDDITVQPGWLEELEKAVNWPDAAVAAPGVFGKDNFHGIEDNYQWYPGYCFMITQDTVNEIGTFDEQFSPFNYEDTDYWTRILMKKKLLMRNYNTIITHREGDVLHKLKYDEISEVNKQKFIAKHGFDPLPIFYQGAKAPWE